VQERPRRLDVVRAHYAVPIHVTLESSGHSLSSRYVRAVPLILPRPSRV